MPAIDEYALNPQHLESGVKLLKKRQRNLMLLGITSTSILLVSVMGLFVQQDFVYSFFGLSTQVEQLHIPSSVGESLTSFGNQSDYFVNLLSWFGWLFLKIFASFIGAFLTIHVLRKIKFFSIRFQSFVLKFVGWLVAFIVIWSGLTYVQYDLRDDHHQEYQQLVRYDKNIQDSALAQELRNAEIAPAVKSYLLAQTAMLHRPIDRATAIPQVRVLVQAEKNDPHFLDYGFKPEQLWTMQNQLFNQTLTPMAESVSKQVAQAEILNRVVYWALLFIIVVTALITMAMFILASRIKSRVIRIEQRIY